MSERQIVNARIRSTHLGYEDHGIFTFLLDLDYGGAGQGFGTYALDEHDGKRRVGTASGMGIIIEILKVVGVEKWEDLPGKYVRADAEHIKVHGIGNVLEDKWLYPEQFFAAGEGGEP